MPFHEHPFPTPRPSRPADVDAGPGAGSEPLGRPRTARAHPALPRPRPLVCSAEASGGAERLPLGSLFLFALLPTTPLASPPRSELAHAPCCRLRVSPPGRPAAKQPSLWTDLWEWTAWDLATSSRGYGLGILACLGGVAACGVTAALWFSNELFNYGQGGGVHRGMGYALAVCLGLMLLPVTRWSIWLHVFGVPFERALRVHRCVSTGARPQVRVHRCASTGARPQVRVHRCLASTGAWRRVHERSALAPPPSAPARADGSALRWSF